MRKTRLILATLMLVALLGLTTAVQAAGYRVVFALGEGGAEKIYAVNPNGTGLTKLSQEGDWWDSMPSASIDGGRIVFVSNRNGNSDIYMMNIDGSDVTQVTDTPEKEFQPVFSNNGKIAFEREVGHNRQIFTLDLQTKTESQLTNASYSNFGPKWSPDGSRIAFYANTDGKANQIFVMDVSGQNIVQVSKKGRTPCWSPDWSPDGQKLVYVTRRWRKDCIYIMNADGKKATALVSKGFNADPHWSPDGQTITYLSYMYGDYDLFTIGVNRKNGRQLTFSYGPVAYPGWAVAPDTNAEDPNKPDFRNIKWGMSRDQVEAEEDASFLGEQKQMLMYSVTLNDLDCGLAYIFAEDKVIAAMHIVTERYTDLNRYIENYNSMKEFLEQEYGPALKSDVYWNDKRYKDTESKWGYAVSMGDLEYMDTWVQDKTRIVLSLAELNRSVILVVWHFSLEYSDLMEN